VKEGGTAHPNKCTCARAINTNGRTHFTRDYKWVRPAYAPQRVQHVADAEGTGVEQCMSP
jgi:hypothetical protein